MSAKYSLESDLELALELAAIADGITMARYLAQDLVVLTKPDNTPVTDADKATEEALRKHLAKERPTDGLVGEEFGNENKEAARYWVIDTPGIRAFGLSHIDPNRIVAAFEDLSPIAATCMTNCAHHGAGCQLDTWAAPDGVIDEVRTARVASLRSLLDAPKVELEQ